MSMRGEVLVTADGTRKVFPTDTARVTIGRGSENWLCLYDLMVSRVHAEILRLGTGFLLRDLGSRNGSYVNGVRITAQMLTDGAVVRLGTAGPELIFRQDQDAALPPNSQPAPRDLARGLISSLTSKLNVVLPDSPEEANVRCALAEAYLNQGRPEAALDVLARYADPAKHGALPPPSRAAMLLWVGRVYVERKLYDRALDLLRRSLEHYVQAVDDNGVAGAHASLGRALIGIGDLLGARDNLHRSLLAARRAGDVRLRSEVHLLLGKTDWQEGDFEGARYNWKRAARLALGLDDPLLLTRTELQQGLLLSTEGRLRDAIPVYQAAIDRARVVGNVPLLLKGYSSLSRVLTRLGLWAAAERLVEDRLRLAREHGLAKAEAIARTDLAEAHLLQGKTPAAADDIAAALRCHGPAVYPRTQRTLGRVLSAQGRPAEALAALEEGLHAASAKGALEEQVLIGLELALVRLELGDPAAAAEQLEAVRALTSLEPTLYLMGRALSTRGAVHAACNQVHEANRSFTQGLSIFQSIGDPFRAGLCHAALGTLRARTGRPESARAHLEEAQRAFARLGAGAELQRVEARLASPDLANVKAALTQVAPGLSQAAPLSMSGVPARDLDTAAAPVPPRVLVGVAADKLATLLVRGLEAENYLVDRVRDGRTALDRAGGDGSYRALVLDALLEHHSGLDVCRELRRRHRETPIILLGGRLSVEDKIEALQAGADDFLGKKNLVFEELLAKLEALLR
jgi:tetratricopeptide (TPR) repeat protein/CheY-like chemotaxis protein